MTDTLKPLYQGENLILTETEKGNLHLLLTTAGKEFLTGEFTLIDPDTGDVSEIEEKNTEMRWNKDHAYYLAELLEDIRCNSSLDLLMPRDYSTIGALTDAPIIANDIDRDDDGDLASVGKVWWFEQYAVESELETLYKTGEAIFTFAPNAGKSPETDTGKPMTEKSKGDLLEAIAILADAGVITASEENTFQDRVETKF